MKPILEVQDIAKKFRIRHLAGGYLNLRERIVQGMRMRNATVEEFWALKDVSFNVQHGESIGIIGRNGAGKSTLLKILSKITPPSTGKIISRGRVASLLEVGTGFHPELTGRENIFFNGSLLGMRRKEIESKFDEIVDFSGTEIFLDTPLKHYSSGMQLRLAFSVAAFLEPEILIIDEVLAVGDAEFQKKCMGKMDDVSKSGRTILFVSHNMAAVENLCSRSILLKQGEVVKDGPSNEVIRHYQKLFFTGNISRYDFNIASEKKKANFNWIEVEVLGNQPRHKLLVKCEIVSHQSHKSAFLAFDIINSIGVTVMQAIPKSESFVHFSTVPQQFQIEIDLPPLIPDTYRISGWMGSHNTETICMEREIISFEINTSPIPGRNFPHSHHNGFLIASSRIVYDKTVS